MILFSLVMQHMIDKIKELKMRQLLTSNNNRNTKNIILINDRKHKLKIKNKRR